MRKLALAAVLLVAAVAVWLAAGGEDPPGELTPVGVAPVTIGAQPWQAPAPPVAVVVPDAGLATAIDASVLDASIPVTPQLPVAPVPTVTDFVAVTVDAGTPVSPTATEQPKREPSDPRFVVRWGKPGLCLEERAAAVAGMTANAAGDAVVYHSGPITTPGLLQEIALSMVDARNIAAGLVDWSTAAPHPVIYLHDSLDELRALSCVNAQAIAYYDGAIHLAANDSTDLQEVRATLHHEYIHHVLNQLGIKRPMWLHEGLAMYAASETWWSDPRLGLKGWARDNHLPFDAMAYAFPHTSDRLFALAAYFQSEQMVLFIIEQRGVAFLRVLVRALANGQVQPDDAFYWSVGLSPAATEQQWVRFSSSD